MENLTCASAAPHHTTRKPRNVRQILTGKADFQAVPSRNGRRYIRRKYRAGRKRVPTGERTCRRRNSRSRNVGACFANRRRTQSTVNNRNSNKNKALNIYELSRRGCLSACNSPYFLYKSFILYFFYGYPYLAVIVLGIIRYRVEIRFDIQISRHTVLLGIGQPLVKYIVIYLL